MSYPIALSIAGHDPTGGAGIQADIESFAGNGCRGVSVITCLTVQDTQSVHKLIPIDVSLVHQQLATLFADIRISAIKIGLLGSEEMINVVADILKQHPSIPVVLDPVLASGSGTSLANKALQDQICQQLLPLVDVATPNTLEARKLAQLTELDACADNLISQGLAHLLITGTHDASTEVVNRLYNSEGCILESSWERLSGEYHGSGCTLASSIAAGLARGLSMQEAVSQGQEYTWQTLARGFLPGSGQSIPDRLFSLSQQ